MKNTISTITLGLALIAASSAHAAFTPIAINSYNHDVVIEAAAPISLNGTVNATMDAGTNNSGNTWYERGYNPAAPTTGLPVAGSLVSDLNHRYIMPPDYHVNNCALIGHNNGGRTPLLSPATFTLSTPAAFSGLSFLTSSGNGPVQVGYIIHFADSSTESGTFNSFDWFNSTPPRVFNASGRVNVSGGSVNSVGNTTAAGALFGADVNVGNSAVNITSIDLYFVGAAANNNPYSNGRAVIFAVSGAKDSSTDYTNTLAVTGFNYDSVVEADGPPTTGINVAAGSTLTNNVTATMDGGTSKAASAWYEAGYYAGFPTTGLPVAGSTINSVKLSASYTMPPSYAANNAVVVASNITSANITFSAPAAYGALSFLCATANGDTFLPCVVQFQDGTTENNTIFVPDWSNRELPWAYHAFGRIIPSNRTLNNTPDQYVDPFNSALAGFDFRNLGLPIARLFDSVINITNTASAVTNISISFTNGLASTRVASIFAVSGALAGNVPPVFGSRGTPTPGQPANAPVNNVSLVKAWEGTNNIVLSVTNIAGTGPISYQWKKAPRGGGLRDKMFSFDYSTFANVVDGGRVSGANARVLVISNALTADSADYLVVASNPYGAVTSTVATVMLHTTNDSVLLGKDAGDVIAPIATDATPVAESIDHVIDRVAQKWLSDGTQSPTCCGGPLPFTGVVGFTVTPVSGASFVTSMRFFTANDTAGRDPYDYALEGSNDGSTWSPITGGTFKGTLMLPTGRNGVGVALLSPLTNFLTEVNFANAVSYKSYRVSITNNFNRFGDPLMQIAEIELLGTFVPAAPVWVRQPEPDVRVFVGAAPNFVAVASGLGSLAPKYQWYRNGSTLIAGATSSSYTLSNAQLADSGATFICVATNNFGMITSTPGTLTVISAPVQSYPAAILGNNPIGYWRLNEGPDNGLGNNGVVTHDYRGGHNGYYSNAVINVNGYSSGDPDTAAEFNGSPNSYVAEIKDVGFARAANTAGATFSVEAWVYGGNQTVGTNAAIVAKGYNGILLAGTGTGTEQFVLDLAGALPNQNFRFLVRDAAGNGYFAQSAIGPRDPAVWHHLLGVCDQPGGKLSLYVDGLLAGSGTIISNAGIIAQPQPMTIGARKQSSGTEFDNPWQGRIDDVAIYNTVLSSNQALSHFFAGQQAPVFTLQPVSISTNENASVTFASVSYGPGTLGYQWYLSDGVNPTTALVGQTSPNLTFVTTAAQNGNNYQMVVSNPYGSTTSSVALLTVASGPPAFLFADLPTSDTVFIGHVIQLRVAASGTEPFTYQWQKNNVNISDDYRTSGSQSSALTIGYAVLSDSGDYRVLVSNGQGTTPSTVDAVLVTNALPAAALNNTTNGWSFNTSGTGAANTGMGNNTVTLTANQGNTISTAFLSNKVSVTAFSASFVYLLTAGANAGADGVTFTLHNDPRATTAIGGGGGALGYSGITPSVAVAMNIYQPNTRGIGFFLTNGVLPVAAAGAYTPILPAVGVGDNANPILVTLNYSGTVLTGTFRDTVTSGTFTTNKTVDIPGFVGASLAYAGFTGADGGVFSTQVISNFTFIATAPPVRITTQRVGNDLILTWPASTGAYLKSSPSLSPAVWTDALDTFRVVGNQARVTVTPLTGTRFFRLDVYP